MARTTGIAWTRSTFNSWIGCTKVGPGCDHCYAEQSDKMRFSKTLGGGTKENPISHWGAGAARVRTSPGNWKQPLRWNALAAEEQRTGILTPAPINQWKGRPGFWPVFCASLADVFDNEVPSGWRFDLWKLIEATPSLSWLLVTKRVGNVYNMVPWTWQSQFPANVRLLITVCNQEEADRDIPKLLALPCKNGISYEPALGPVDWAPWLKYQHPSWLERELLQWVIIGGESTQGAGKARPFDLAWARNTIAQCKAAGVPVFVKQIGSHTLNWCLGNRPSGDQAYADLENIECQAYEASEQNQPCPPGICVCRDNRAGADPAEWPSDLRVQCFPT
jgi:protein gp37